MSLRISRHKLEIYREIDEERNDEHYNNCLEHLKELNDSEFIEFSNSILNRTYRNGDIPNLHPHQSYVSMGDMDRWRRAIREVSRSKGLKYTLTERVTK